MKTYFIRATAPSKGVVESLKKAVLEYEHIDDYDRVFALSYDREDQFFIKTGEFIVWSRVFNTPAGHQDLSELAKEIQRLQSTFNLPLRIFAFFQELTSGHGLLKALPGNPRCFQYSFLSSESGSALALKDLCQAAPKVLPPAPEGFQVQSTLPRLSRSEISELIEISLGIRKLTN